mmetsp:Transcript_27876/g.59241  ORF Transcript_27876/g.59241 Transcript_27876/m.59241 type:complete len:129 (-) Transcript_27876:92-478(-)
MNAVDRRRPRIAAILRRRWDCFSGVSWGGSALVRVARDERQLYGGRTSRMTFFRYRAVVHGDIRPLSAQPWTMMSAVGTDGGSAFVFMSDDGEEWTLRAKLLAPDGFVRQYNYNWPRSAIQSATMATR